MYFKKLKLSCERILILSMGLGILLAGCQTPSTQNTMDKSPLTPGQISLTLKKGQTTQEEVLKAFGSPNMVTQSADNKEVWTYQRQATSASSTSGASFFSLFLLGTQQQNAQSETSSRTITLIIKFNGRIVEDYSSQAAQF
jgi:hypothetical protein